MNRGDTIGTVGNTGNARTTPPHLHFSIYKHFSGAIDPINYIHLIRKTDNEETSQVYIAETVLGISSIKANFRPSPSSKTPIISIFIQGQKVNVIGISGNWYHVRDISGKSGFIYKTNLSILP